MIQRAPLPPEEFLTPEDRLAAAGIITDDATGQPQQPQPATNWGERIKKLAEDRTKDDQAG